MGVIKSIVEKLKLKEIAAMVLIATIIITFLPNDWAQKLGIDVFRNSYQTYISLSMILTGSYYILCFLGWIKNLIWSKTHSWEKIAIKYMKENMSPDEMSLLIEAFYDHANNRFRSSGKIDYSDGRKAPLKSRHIIYLASRMGTMVYGFSYNLQPYALDFLNRNLREGNIHVTDSEFKYQLK